MMNYTVDMGDAAVFECVATGIPAPSITWFRNGMELNNNTNSRVTLSDHSDPVLLTDGNEGMIFQVSRTLTLSMTEDGDSGTYNCTASNAATPGEDTMSFELVVQSKCHH